MSKNIAVQLIVDGAFQAVVIPEKLAQELLVKLRRDGKTLVHLTGGTVEAEGMVVAAQGSEYGMMVLPGLFEKEEENA